jgi:hypothetical protein
MVRQTLTALFVLVVTNGILGCSPKRIDDPAPIPFAEMQKGEEVNYFWIDHEVDFSSFGSIQIPDFQKKEIDQTSTTKPGSELNDPADWIYGLIADTVADHLSKWKVFGIMDRSPKPGAAWTDLVLEGIITSIESNPEGRTQISVECSLLDNRSKKMICFIRHQKFMYATTIGSSNPLKTISEEIGVDLARFLKKTFDLKDAKKK